MADAWSVAALVLVSAAVTWALRALPFAALAPLRGSAAVRHLAVHMPLGVMIVLAAYTVRGVDLTDTASVVAFPAAVVTTLALHLWWRTAVVSIVGGTLVHVVLATLLAG